MCVWFLFFSSPFFLLCTKRDWLLVVNKSKMKMYQLFFFSFAAIPLMHLHLFSVFIPLYFGNVHVYVSSFVYWLKSVLITVIICVQQVQDIAIEDYGDRKTNENIPWVSFFETSYHQHNMCVHIQDEHQS